MSKSAPTLKDIISVKHTKPKVSGGSFVFSKKGTACSPVTTPRFVVSAAWNNWKNTLFSSWVRFRLGGAVNRNIED
jgi:hypothetical protein